MEFTFLQLLLAALVGVVILALVELSTEKKDYRPDVVAYIVGFVLAAIAAWFIDLIPVEVFAVIGVVLLTNWIIKQISKLIKK